VVTDDDDDDDDDDEVISGSLRQFADIMFGARLTKTAEMDIAMVLVEWGAYNNNRV
jgi:hypothetical protein